MTDKQQIRELKEKLDVIENILHEFLLRRDHLPKDSEVAAEIIHRIQCTTGDETFVCNPVVLHYPY